MMTLRELRDHSDKEFNPILCAQILMAVIQSPIVPESPDDVIADPEQDVFKVAESGSGDLSFVSPAVLLTGRKPNAEDKCYTVGMVIHYIWGEPFEDLAIASEMPFVRLYTVDDGMQSPILCAQKTPNQLETNVMLRLAVALTGGDIGKRAQAAKEIQDWVSGFDSRIVLRLKEGNRIVGELAQGFPKNTRRMMIRSGQTIRCGGAKYSIVNEHVVDYMPGQHVLEVAVRHAG